MPTKPKIVTLTNASVDILNAIRNSASTNYRDYVPLATNSAESIREIGATIMDNPSLQNEFLSALVNRIGKVLIVSKTYDNPLAMFKQGMLELGETIEEIFVNIAKAQDFDPDTAASELFKREIPDVRAAFHIMNYQKFYKSTVTQEQLKQAFLSWEGVYDLIAKVVNAMYTGANYDEFITMKYMLAKRIINGQLYPVTIPTVSSENMKAIVGEIKSVSNDMTFLSNKYNIAGVHNNTEKENQYVIMNSKFDAKVDVEVLASAFNMDKAEFIGKRVLVDSFGSLDTRRLDELFSNDPTYTHIDDKTLKALDEIPAVIVDKAYFMIFDNFVNFTEAYNGQGLYWNYFYHVWKTFSVSPFANSIMFIPATPSVNGITLTPSTASVTKGGTLQFTVDVQTENFAPKDVDFSVNEGAKATITKSGLLTVDESAVEGDKIVVTAKSVYNDLVFTQATVTVGEGGAPKPSVVTSEFTIKSGQPKLDLTSDYYSDGEVHYFTQMNVTLSNAEGTTLGAIDLKGTTLEEFIVEAGISTPTYIADKNGTMIKFVITTTI